MVRIEGLRKAFGGRPALEGISFDVGRGEIFGLLGHNGAGKSTTFGILLGMVAPDGGLAEIDGLPVPARRSAALERVGAIFEAPAFYDYLSGWDNLRFFVSLSGRRIPRAELESVVGLVGLADRIGDPVRTYSHGMRQRLGVAQALVPRPRLLLLDEPTDGLDPLGIREMRAMIRRFRDEFGITVVLSSHLLSEVEQLCDRVAILHQGRMAFCGEWRGGERRWIFDCDPAPSAEGILASFGFRKLPSAWEAPGAEPDIPGVVEALVRAGIKVRRVEPVRATLEDFYLERLGA